MDITRDQQIALDDALVALANRLKIDKSILRLSSDLNSKEATLQVVYDQFKELPFEEEILKFLRDLGHSGEIKLKSFGGMYRKKNVDYAYLLWEDFVYQVENKAMDNPMFTMIKVVSRHEDTQLYGVILPDELTNKAIKDSESYKEYYAIASRAEPPKTKASKRLKTLARAKPAKKKQPAKTSKAKGLTVLSEVTLTKAEQMELATKRSLIQTHSSHASGSGTDEGTGDIPGVPYVPTYASDDEQISWKSSDKEDDDEVAMNHKGPNVDNEQTDSDNDGDDFVHPKFSTHDKEDSEEEGSDLRVQTPSHYESTNDEESDEVTHGANIKGEELDEEVTKEEDEANELYRDVNVNLEGRDTEMTDAPRTIIQTTQVIEDTHVIITPVNPEDVPVTTIAEPPLSSTTTLPPPTIPLITHLQQTPAPTLTTVLSSSLQDLPNFGFLFGFNHRLKNLETDFSEFKQTNQFAAAVSSIPGIVDADEAQAENEDFINKLDDNIKKIIKDQVKEDVKEQVSKILPKIEKTVNEQLEAEIIWKVISQSTYLIQNNLYKALVDAYESEKLILDTYGDTVSFKRRQDDENKDEEPSVGSDRGSKRRRARKEPESTSAVTSENFSNSRMH
ncbi:hypothetical protein Tco_0797951 [Tanacetum coccineum]